MTFYLSVTTKWQVDGKTEDVLHKLLEGAEQTVHLFFGDAEAQEHTHSHVEGEPLGLAVHIYGVRIGAPHTQGLLNDLLDLGQVAFQSLVAKNFSKDLRKTQIKKVQLVCCGDHLLFTLTGSKRRRVFQASVMV